MSSSIFLQIFIMIKSQQKALYKNQLSYSKNSPLKVCYNGRFGSFDSRHLLIDSFEVCICLVCCFQWGWAQIILWAFSRIFLYFVCSSKLHCRKNFPVPYGLWSAALRLLMKDKHSPWIPCLFPPLVFFITSVETFQASHSWKSK